MATPIKQYPITKTVFDLNTFEEVTLTKNVPDFIPAENTTEVLARVGNDGAKMLELLNAGLKAAERDAIADNTAVPYMVSDDSTDPATEKPFEGIPANMEKVNALKLTLAKTVFGYSKSMTPEEKQAAKQNAIEMIKNTPAIKTGLQKSAA